MSNDSIRTRNTIADNIAADLLIRIEEGAYPVGSRLPGRRGLAAQYDVAPLTIQQAMNALMAEGVIRSEAGRGTFVSRRTKSDDSALGTVGIIAEFHQDGFIASLRRSRYLLLNAAERAVSASGGTTLFVNRQSGDELMPMREAVDILLAKNVGTIVFLSGREDETLEAGVDYCRRHGALALVLTVNPFYGTVPHVMPDNVKGGEQAASHLIERGCSKILFFSAVTALWVDCRLEGVRKAVRSAGLPPENLITYLGGIDAGEAEWRYHFENVDYLTPEVEAALDRLGEFDGVVCSNDFAAVAFMGVSEKRGLESPRDYLMVGFDDTDESRWLGISSMQQPFHDIGDSLPAVLRQLARDPNAQIDLAFPFHLLARATTLKSGNPANVQAQSSEGVAL